VKMTKKGKTALTEQWDDGGACAQIRPFQIYHMKTPVACCRKGADKRGAGAAEQEREEMR